jgi:hypothetical protein
MEDACKVEHGGDQIREYPAYVFPVLSRLCRQLQPSRIEWVIRTCLGLYLCVI